ncbi:Ras association domain-containing protein 8 [Pristimantis euphronides]
MAKLRPQNDKSIKRREPKRKSLTFTGGAKGLIDIFGKGKESEFKQKVLNNYKTTGEDLKKLVHLQTEKLLTLEKQLDSNDAEVHYWEQKYKSGLEDEIEKWEQKIKRNNVEIGEEEFWENEFQIEVENEKQLKEQLQEMTQRMLQCESQLRDYHGQIQRIENGIEAERLQMVVQESQINEEIVGERSRRSKETWRSKGRKVYGWTTAARLWSGLWGKRQRGYWSESRNSNS